MRTFLLLPSTLLLIIGFSTINAIQAKRLDAHDAEAENSLVRRRILQTSMSLSTIDGLKGAAEGMCHKE